MEPSSRLERYTDIIKSPTDHRDYAMVCLPNGLRCALVHDPEAHQSTAALAVAAGHFQDPIENQGLAHFLEHMLFLGTRKYPETLFISMVVITTLGLGPNTAVTIAASTHLILPRRSAALPAFSTSLHLILNGLPKR